MTKQKLTKLLLVGVFSGYLVLGATMGGRQLVSGETFDSRIEESIDIVVGEIQSVTVYSPTRISLADPKIADIVKIETGKELILTGKTPGSTTLNIWDRYGQRSMMVRVVAEDLEKVKNRLEQLLTNIKIKNLSMEINRDEGKIVLQGNVFTIEKDRLNDILEPFRKSIFNFIKINDDNTLVQIDVQILELSKTAEENIGIDWNQSIKFSETAASAAKNVTSILKIFEDKTNWTRDNTLQATINLLISEGKARVLSRPKLVCMSGKEASFMVGGQIPITTTTTSSGGNVATNIEFRDYGITVKIKPVVKEDNKIDINLSTDVSDLDFGVGKKVGSGSIPAVTTRNAQTQLYLEDGQTIYLAGLIKNYDSENVSRVPVLSKIPILGKLFQSPDFINNQTELVISLTTTIIKSPEKETETKPTVDLTAKAPLASRAADTFTEEKTFATLKELPDYMVEYARKVQEKITQTATYPEEARQLGWEGTVRLNLRLLSDGTISEIKVKQSSGYEIFDDSAIAAAKKQSPYPTFPAELRAREISLDVPVVYNLNPNS